MAVRLALVMALAAVPLTAAAQAPPQGFQRSIWSLVVNSVPKGETSALLRGTEVWVPVATLDDAGLKGFTGQRDTLMGQVHVLLASLEPGITTRLDLAQTVMYLTAAPEFFAETRLVLQTDRPPGLVLARNASVFMDYSATWDQTAGTSGYGDAGVSLRGNISFSSNFSVDADGKIVRGLSTFTLDRPHARQRLQIGDTVPQATAIGSSPIMLGVSFGRDYSLDPYYYHYPSPSFHGTVTAPSDVDVYVNNVLVRRLKIGPGAYQLDRLPLTSGIGDVRIVLRDPFGRLSEINSGVYLATGLLNKGEQDYQYVAGAIRDDSSGSPVYGDIAGVAMHRIGVTDWLTVGASAEAGRIVADKSFGASQLIADQTADVVAFGPNMSLRLARWGEFEIHTSVSRTSDQITGDRTTGYAAYGLYNFVGRWLNLSALAQYYDPGYANIWQKPGENDTPEYYQATVGVPLFRVGSVTYTFEQKRSPAGNFGLTQPDGTYDSSIVPSVTHSLRTSMRVLPRTQLSLNVSMATVRQQQIWSGLAGLTVAIGSSTTASATYSHTPDSEATYLDLSKALPVGPGFGYRVSASDASKGSAFSEFSVNTPYNQMRATYDVSDKGERTNASVTLAGGLIVAGGGFFMTRPLESSVAVVQVSGLKNVRILADNVEVARTGRTGRALVPRLLPYLANRISFDESDVPFDYQVPVSSQLVAPPFRGAASVKFLTARIQGRSGSVLMTIDGRDVVPSYGKIVVTLPAGPIESPLNEAGEFFLDLPDGHHTATVTFHEQTCTITFEAISTKGELIQKLGVLRCTR
jgi:outer membrane usher protein